jgi:hypothetical protein
MTTSGAANCQTDMPPTLGAGLHFEGTELVAAISDRTSASAYHVTKTADGEIKEQELDVQRLKR